MAGPGRGTSGGPGPGVARKWWKPALIQRSGSSEMFISFEIRFCVTKQSLVIN